MSLSGQDLTQIQMMIDAAINAKIPAASSTGRGLVQVDQPLNIGDEIQVVSITSKRLKTTAKAIALGGII